MVDKLSVYIGIDPGNLGYICLLEPISKKVAYMSNSKTPKEIYDWLKKIQNNYNIIICMIEDVHSIFGASAKSNFSFGRNVEKITTIPLTLGISVDLVQPKVWQKFIGIKPKSKNIKKDVASICKRLYPLINISGPRGGLIDGKSDSLMITYYGFHKYKI